MDIEKLIDRLGENTDCWTDKVHGYADLRLDAATALSTLQAENEKLRNEVERQRRSADDRKHLYENAERAYMKVVAELEQVKRALAMMWYAYDNKDGEFPHEYEIEAMQKAENVLGPWAECMPKYLQRGPEKED